MKQAEISEIKQRVEALSHASWLGPQLSEVNIEPLEDGLGGEFLRVDLVIKHPDQIEWNNVADLVRSIEDLVLAIDDRFPSVFFPEPA